MAFCCRIKSLAGCLVALLLLPLAGSAAAASPHYVFAHYMVCYSLYGQSLQGYENEIQDARAAGIDGFAMDVGEWNGPDTYYKTNVELLYEAAEHLNNGFKLFFTVDMPQTNDIVQMISQYAYHTNSFYYNGKLVISSFLQTTLDWTNGVFQPLAAMGITNIFFIPFFDVTTGWPNAASMSALLASDSSFLNGEFLFGVGLPTDITNLNTAFQQACQSNNLLFMAGCSPSYWGCQQLTSGRTYFESQGGEGLAMQWNWIIQNQPPWVEIATWNDLNESTYINPLATPDQNYQTPPKRYSHAGYYELMEKYITSYKTGQPLVTNQDAVYYFYRTHSTNAVALNTNDVPVTAFLGQVQDVIYNTVTLASPASLEIISGTNSFTNSLPAGLTNLRTPFSPGIQQFTIRRAGALVLTVQGPPVLSQITNYDYFVASGYASPPVQSMEPPSDLHVTGPH